MLITGAGSGIGRLMALGAAERGAKAVIIWDLKPDETAAEIQAMGVDSVGMVVDVTDGPGVDASGQDVLARFGRVDILINNAGIVTGKKFLELTDRDAERTFAVNTLSHYKTTRQFLPGMIERDRGSVVTIASAAGLIGVARQTGYSASKFGAVGFAESLRAELRHEGSNVHTLLVCPYYIDTGMFEGVKTKVPLLLPILKPERVAAQVLDAIEAGNQMKVLPTFARSSMLLKILPVPLQDPVADLFGINSTMDEFTGRKAPAEK